MLWNLRAHLLAALVVGLTFTACPFGGDDDDDTAGDDDDATSAATIDCSDSTVNPLKDSCLEAIATVCDVPTGSCELTTSGLNTEIKFTNGVKFTVENNVSLSPSDILAGKYPSFTDAQEFTVKEYKADGKTVCLNGETKLNVGSCYAQTTYTTTDGKTFVFCTTKEGDSTLTCPDGTTESYNSAQETAIKACTPGTPSSFAGCKTNISIPGAGGIPGL